MSRTNGTGMDNQDGLMPVRAPLRWIKLFRRLMGLEAGRRYQITLTTDSDRFDWSVVDLGRVEKP